MRGPLPGRLPAEEFFLLGPVSSDGLRSVDLSREPARHRSVPAIDEQQALPHGVPRSRGALHAGGSQRVARLAHLCLSLIHISEPTRLGMISYAVFCLKKK